MHDALELYSLLFDQRLIAGQNQRVQLISKSTAIEVNLFNF